MLVVAAVQSLSCVRLCDPMNCSLLGSPVLHHLLKFAFDVLESSPNHPPSQSMEKLSPTKPVAGAKKVGDHCSRGCKT